MLALIGALALTSPAHADTLRATLAVDGDGLRIVHAVRLQGEVEAHGQGVDVVDRDGRVLASASVPPLAHFRSVVTPDGHETARIPSRYVRVTVPWEDGAHALRFDDREVVPLPDAVPIADASIAERVHGDGPAAHRLDLLILPEGYTDADEALFDDHVDAIVQHMMSIEPYTAYGDLLNVWTAFLPSNERGVDQPDAEGGPIDVDTRFDCAYGCDLAGTETPRLVCCDEDRILQTMNAQVPFADGALVLLNSARYGGSGGQIYAATYTGDDAALQVAAHELGHTLIGLWDEYGYGIDQPTDATYISPNCAAAGEPVPWAPWLRDGPIDWAAWQQAQRDNVGAPFGSFTYCDGRDGADRANFVCAYPTCSFDDWVRPTLNACMMGQLQSSYCPICRESIVRALYRGLGPAQIASADPPPGDALELDEDEEVLFTVDVLGPQEGLEWTWSNGNEVLHTGPDFTLSGADKVCGDLTLTVRDLTPWVRSDPDDVLAETVRWDVRTAPCCGCATGAPAPGIVWFATLLLWRRRRLR